MEEKKEIIEKKKVEGKSDEKKKILEAMAILGDWINKNPELQEVFSKELPTPGPGLSIFDALMAELLHIKYGQKQHLEYLITVLQNRVKGPFPKRTRRMKGW